MKKLITIFFLIASNAQAQFSGFPFSQNYTNADANWIGTNFHPMQQLYSGVVERVNLINNGGSTITPLELVNTYVCSAGTGFSYTVDGSNTYTNILLFTTNVTVTNTFTPFAYTYSDTSGVHSATAMPFVTRGMISDIDAKIDELMPYFICRTISTNGLLDKYFTTNRFKTGDDIIPRESRAGMFSRIGIGFATNLTTNAYGFVTGGDAYYTRQPPTTNLYLLGEGTFTSNGWASRAKYNLDLYYYKTNAPIIRYYNGGTNPLTSIDIYVAGSYLKQDDQTTVATSKTYTVTATNTPLDLVWYNVTNISSATDSFNTNDVYAVVYTNNHPTYGSAIDKYFLTSSDYDERYKVLTNLVWTRWERTDTWAHPGVESYTTGRIYTGQTSFFNTNWANALANASNSIAATTNWAAITNLAIEQATSFGAENGIEAYYNDTAPRYEIYLASYYTFDLLDVYEGISGIPTNGWKMQVYRRASDDGGVLTNAPDYYNFSSPNFPLYYEYDYAVSLPTYTASHNLPLSFFDNPAEGLPEPTTNNAYLRYQIMKNELFVLDWSAGLQYK